MHKTLYAASETLLVDLNIMISWEHVKNKINNVGSTVCQGDLTIRLQLCWRVDRLYVKEVLHIQRIYLRNPREWNSPKTIRKQRKNGKYSRKQTIPGIPKIQKKEEKVDYYDFGVPRIQM